MDEIREEGFEAVYAATGKEGWDFGTLSQKDGYCLMDGGIAVFGGGSLAGRDPIRALADGLDIARSIEIFLKTGKLEYPAEAGLCRAVADPAKLKKTEAVIPTDNGLFTDKEAALEAERCIRCQCSACMTYCDVCSYYNLWPMRIRDDVMSTVAFSTSPSIMKKTPAKRLMNSCTQCGLCDEVCPENIEIGGMLLEARRNLHRHDTMPGAYHQFWVRDMEFTNGEAAALAKKPPGQQTCTYAFFPGCQLPAADPRYVSEPYRWLLSKQPDTGLILRCCGIPADWAGNEEMHRRSIDALRGEWEALGRPVLILACPACRKHMKEYLPEIETTTLYEILDQWGFEISKKQKDAAEKAMKNMSAEGDGIFSIFDPCTARHVESLEGSVRKLAKKAGALAEELPGGDLHGCCGYGGHAAMANSDYYDHVVKKRSSLSSKPFLVYCINCRDVFRGETKPTLHILDLLFGIGLENGRMPSLTGRRRNRTELKKTLLREIWGENMENVPEKFELKLLIGSDVLDKMDRLKILEEDVRRVIGLGEAKNRRTFDPRKGTYTCYRESGHITYWVEYRKSGDEYEIVNAYTHRMKIKLEGVWNGRKTETDL